MESATAVVAEASETRICRAARSRALVRSVRAWLAAEPMRGPLTRAVALAAWACHAARLWPVLVRLTMSPGLTTALR
jgi:hypothetical protein